MPLAWRLRAPETWPYVEGGMRPSPDGPTGCPAGTSRLTIRSPKRPPRRDAVAVQPPEAQMLTVRDQQVVLERDRGHTTVEIAR